MLLPLFPRILRACRTAGDAMSKVFLGGFVVISSVAVGAVDYVNQARRAGSAPGAFAAAAYFGTVSGRITGAAAPAAPRAAVSATEPPPATVPGEAERLIALRALDLGVQQGKLTEGAAAVMRARLMQQPADTIPAAAAASAQSATARGAGGILGLIGGLLGGKSDGAAPDASRPKPEVRVNGLGANCTVAGSIKRCSIGGG